MLRFPTSKKGTPHISSADWASLNCATLGKGKYILTDISANDTGDFLVSIENGTVTIPPRSFVWSGKHIRNTTSEVLTYVPPTYTATVSVWFHYTKDADTSIENIAFEVFVDSQPDVVVDEISDSTIEAYTLLYTFLHDVESQSLKNPSFSFERVKSLSEIAEKNAADVSELADDISSLNTSVSTLTTKINTETSERKTSDTAINNTLNNHTSRIATLEDSRFDVLVKDNRSTGRIYNSSVPLDTYKFFIAVYNHNEPFAVPAYCRSISTSSSVVTENFSHAVYFGSLTGLTKARSELSIIDYGETFALNCGKAGITPSSSYWDELGVITDVFGVY